MDRIIPRLSLWRIYTLDIWTELSILIGSMHTNKAYVNDLKTVYGQQPLGWDQRLDTNDTP